MAWYGIFRFLGRLVTTHYWLFAPKNKLGCERSDYSFKIMFLCQMDIENMEHFFVGMWYSYSYVDFCLFIAGDSGPVNPLAYGSAGLVGLIVFVEVKMSGGNSNNMVGFMEIS